jgi:hypothetical protein
VSSDHVLECSLDRGCSAGRIEDGFKDRLAVANLVPSQKAGPERCGARFMAVSESTILCW